MAYPYTPAQLAAFRSALATLEGGIAEGNKALTDEKYIGLMQSVERIQRIDLPQEIKQKPLGVEATVTTPDVAVPIDTQSKPKSLFGFPWFAKKTTLPVKSQELSKPGLGQLAEPQKFNVTAVPSHEAAKPKPSLTADAGATNRFFAGLPWSAPNKSSYSAPALEQLSDFPQGQGAQQKVPTNGDLPRSDDSVDTRVVGSFFSGLPWDAKETEMVSGRPAEAPGFGEGLLPAIVTVHDVQKTVVPLAYTNNVSGYFGGLPWGTRPSIQTVDRSEATVIAGLEVSNKSPISGVAGKANHTHTVKVFFQTIPWDQKNASSNVLGEAFDFKQDLPVRQAGQIDSTKATALVEPMGKYFKSLPWQGGISAKAIDLKQNHGEWNGVGSSIFAAATQSALRASQKGTASESPLTAKNTEKYFSSLPWNGSG